MSKSDNDLQEDSNYPGFAESMRDITVMVSRDPQISTTSSPKFDSNGKRILRQFTDGRGTFSEMDQGKNEKKIIAE